MRQAILAVGEVLGVLACLLLVAAAQQSSTQPSAEIERLEARAAETKTASEQARSRCEKRLAETPEYKAAKADVQAKQAFLEEARSSGTVQQKLEASSAYNRARGVVDEMWAKAARADKDVSRTTAAAEAAARALSDAKVEAARRVAIKPRETNPRVSVYRDLLVERENALKEWKATGPEKGEQHEFNLETKKREQEIMEIKSILAQGSPWSEFSHESLPWEVTPKSILQVQQFLNMKGLAYRKNPRLQLRRGNEEQDRVEFVLYETPEGVVCFQVFIYPDTGEVAQARWFHARPDDNKDYLKYRK